ncbi:MAG: Uncharacterized protein G01um10143_194 [Parcubacteria group bacterium Gr01-1014_3]|nr:MAG: Uncharacterized protein G01um10143_194 [Parcubacteria group bacterium Gr01-1014_3]
MVTKLKSVFHSQQLRLAVKALIFGGFLVLAKIGNLGLFPVLFFIFVASFLYFKPIFNPTSQLNNLTLLLVVSIIFANLLNNFDYFLGSAVFASVIFYLILGVKDLVLIRREAWSRFIALALVLAMAFLFFNSAAFSGLVLKTVVLFIGYCLVFHGVFSSEGGSASGGKNRTLTLSAALILLELSLVARLLPLTSLNAASLVLLGYFALTDLTDGYINKTLNRKMILTDLTIFIVLSLLIFASTEWSLIA